MVNQLSSGMKYEGLNLVLYCIVLYCIVYLDIYIAPLTAKAKHRCSLVNFSSRKKVRLKTRERRRKRKWKNTGAKRGGSQLQREGPIDAKDRVWAIVVRERGRERSWWLEERRGRREEAERGGMMWSWRHLRAEPSRDLRTRKRTLNSMQAVRGSQWSWSIIKEKMCEKQGRREMSWAAELNSLEKR